MNSKRWIQYKVVDVKRFKDAFSNKLGIDYTVYGIEVMRITDDSCSIKTVPAPEHGSKFSVSNSLLTELLKNDIIERKDF